MARRVAWTETAWRDLERIADYIAEDSPGYAAALVRRIRDQSGSLDELAERGRMAPELDEPAVREVLVGSYRLIYEVSEGDVYVLGVTTAPEISLRCGAVRVGRARNSRRRRSAATRERKRGFLGQPAGDEWRY